MRAKLTNNYVKSYVEKYGYKLISEYKGAQKKIKLICPNKHFIEMWWSDFYSHNHRCRKCYFEKRKPSIDVVKKYSKENALICLDTKYLNSGTPMKFKCSYGHIFYRTWSDLQRRPRCAECWKLTRFGEGSPAWKGGISCEPYCEQWSDKDYKESIKKRDGYKCLNPECNKLSNRLSIHHINYNKKDCHPSNLITVCPSCNSKANKDRQWHKSWYNAIIYRRYYQE